VEVVVVVVRGIMWASIRNAGVGGNLTEATRHRGVGVAALPAPATLSIMRRFAIPAVLLLALLPGCIGATRPVMTLGPEQPIPDLATVGEPAVQLYLFASTDEKTPVYSITLKKYEKYGFVRTGTRVEAVARGILISLPDRSEGVTYTWRVAEK